MELISPWDFFSLQELKCLCGKCNSTGLEMDYDFMAKIIICRRMCNFEFKINSAYRCSYHNEEVSKTGGKGVHTKGRALDISCDGWHKYLIIKSAFNVGLTGIGIYSNRVHLDNCTLPEYPRPIIWQG